MRPSSPPSKCLAQLRAANGYYDYAVWQHVEDSEQSLLPSTWSFAFLLRCFILATQFCKLLNQEVREARIVPAVDLDRATGIRRADAGTPASKRVIEKGLKGSNFRGARTRLLLRDL